jgi:hypothetical protein
MQKISNIFIVLTYHSIYFLKANHEKRVPFFGCCKINQPLGRPMHRWKENIKMDLGEMGWGARTESIWHRTGTGDGLL